MLNTYGILQQHIINSIDSTNTYKIIQISPSVFLHGIIHENNNMFKSYITYIINSILITYNLTVNYLDTQFNDSVIWIIFSYTNIVSSPQLVEDHETESYLSLLPPEILQESLLNLDYDNIKRLCSTNKEYMDICKYDGFWRAKFIHDYGFNPIIKELTKSLEEIYLYQNSVWSFGENEDGQLGLNDNIKRNRPTKIPTIFEDSLSESGGVALAKSVSSGMYHTVIIDMNNIVWSFGSNRYGQLGLGGNTNRNRPTKITVDSHSESGLTIHSGITAKFVSCGGLHTVIIDMNNEIWVFGDNFYGQLGLGDNTERNKPTKISGIFAKFVSCGDNYTVIIDMNNEVWSFGSNMHSELGLGDIINRDRPIKITIDSHSESGLAMRSGITAKYVSCGGNHTVIIDMNNEIWVFGENRDGQLGLEDNRNRDRPTKINGFASAKFVSCGNAHTVIIDMNNEVWTFGINNDGQLGLG